MTGSLKDHLNYRSPINVCCFSGGIICIQFKGMVIVIDPQGIVQLISYSGSFLTWINISKL